MKLQALLLLLVSAVLVAASSMVSAQRSLECQTVWNQSSASNDIVACLGDSSRIGSQWRYYVYPGFAALFFVFTAIAIPIIFCCACGKCCGVTITGGEKAVGSRCWLWMWIILAVIAGIGVFILIIYGAVVMTDSANKLLKNANTTLVGQFEDIRSNVLELTSNYENGEGSPIDVSDIDNMIADIQKQATKLDDEFSKYFTAAKAVAITIGVIGFLLVLFIILFACCRCGGCCPLCYSCAFFWFALLYSVLAIIFTVVMYFMYALCGEVDLQYQRVPGVFQWYLVPWCDEQFDFQDLLDQLNAEEKDASREACQNLLQYCDNSDVYDPNTQIYFKCGQGLSSASTCTTLDQVVDIMSATKVKGVLSNMLCIPAKNYPYIVDCTLAQCAKTCTDYTNPSIQAKQAAIMAQQSINYAINVSAAIAYVTPLMSCNYVVDVISSVLQTPTYKGSYQGDSTTYNTCSDVRASSVMLGTGFFVGVLVLLIGFYIMARGVDLWSRQAPAYGASSKVSEASGRATSKGANSVKSIKSSNHRVY